jgi:glyoxylase-like metal-dependent hydrolase (beta-lactamase superfamily II)
MRLGMTQLDELTTVVLAPNPSPMTLDGTNTYLLGAAGTGEVVLVDPGPALPAHRRAIDAALATLDAAVAVVVLTHHHGDHADAAGWAEEWGAELYAYTPALVRGAARPLHDAAVLDRAGVRLQAIHTPGHSSDHLCLRVLDSDVVLTGDHILGRGTTVVLWPDGDMGSYVASLRRLAEVPARALYPGHGPVLGEPRAVVAGYLDHRMERERQVLDALVAGDRTAVKIVARVYADVDPVVHRAAERSVRAHLEKLAAEGRITREAGPVAGLDARFHP